MGEPIRVLHVDDEADFAETAARFLEREDDAFEVVTETSAAAGLDRIEATEVDCVVSDYQMPGTDGIEFLARVRDRYPDLPFVLFTGQGSEAVAGEAISAGATDYLQKETGTEQYGILANRVRNAVESRRTERAVERTRARLRAIVDLLPHPLYVVDREGTYLLANEALASLHDRTVEEVEGTTIREVLSEEEVEQFLSDVAEVVETGERKRVPPAEVVDADGETREFEPHLLPLDLAGTDDTVVVGVAVEITEQERQRREVERVRNQLRTLIDAIPAAVYIEDLDGQFGLVNEYVAEQFAAGDGTAAGLEGTAIEDVFPKEVAERLRESNRAAAAGEAVDGEEVVLPTPDGDHVFRRYVAPVADETGEPYAVCGVSVDVTEDYERRRELERQNERLEEFAGVLSHDLRNPLMVAQGRLEALAAESDSEHVAPAVDALDRMERIVEDTLTLAQQGATVGDTQAVDLEYLARDSWDDVETGSASLAVGDLPTVQADPERLRHVFENLYRNAVEHGGPAVAVEVGPLADGFFVADDGPGIPPDDRDRAFRPGFSTADDGTGFGLSIVADIVEAHGWEITVTDRDEETATGARFEVTGVGRPV